MAIVRADRSSYRPDPNCFAWWIDHVLRPRRLPEHLAKHISTMVRCHAENRYDRLTHDIETIAGTPATSVRDFVAGHADLFAPRSALTAAAAS